VEGIEERLFSEKLKKRVVEYHATLKKENIQKLATCLGQIKEDIPVKLH
jgi:hypothetical protein